VRSRRLILAAGWLLFALSACAPKTVAPVIPGAPHYPEFVFPAAAAAPSPQVQQAQEAAWQRLQAGDLRGSERAFSSITKTNPAFYPAEAGLGYVALARKDSKAAVAHFDRALTTQPTYAPALAGRGQAYLAMNEREQALASFDAALAADPTLSAVRSAADVLRFQGLQGGVGAARAAAEAGRLAEARAAYQEAIAASPQSPFLFRELSAVERRDGALDAALSHATRASELEPTDARNFVAVADVLEAQGQFARAADALATAASLDPSDALTARINALREKSAFANMPEEYRTIDQAPAINRGQLAALIGVELDDVIKRAPGSTAVLTDVRTHWAAPWIINVNRAGVMDAYANHTFQPNGRVNRGDLAVAVSRLLNLIAADNPKLAARWRNARRKFADLAPGHLSYPAASVAVESGVMSVGENGNFELTRPVTGAEAIAAVKKLRELASARR
jgi:tetratricopeptide (TPR) repeat protein